MRVGFIGLGNMGGPAAHNVLRGGHSLVVHDVNRDAAAAHLAAAATWADSPRAVAEASEIVLTSLPGPKEVEAVVLGPEGVLAGAQRGSIYADLSTSSPTLIRRIHALGAERGVDVLDAPVSGGPSGAASGKLSIMVGGDAAVLERARPVLACIGDAIEHIGAVGDGMVAKMVHNTISQCVRAAAVEALLVGVKAGVDPRTLERVLQNGAFGKGYFLRESLPNILAGNFETPRGGQGRGRKDLELTLALAGEFDVPTPIASYVEQLLVEAVGRGWSERSANAYVQLQEERAGVQLRAQKE